MAELGYQTNWKRGVWFLAGLGALGAFLDAIGNALAIVTPSITVIGTIVFLAVWGLAELVIRVRRPRWRLDGGQPARLTALGLQPRWFVLGAILLLWIPRGVDYLKQRATENTPPAAPTVEFHRYPQ